MSRNTIKDRTVKHDLCINCGICKIVCKYKAIKMELNKYGELNPVIDKNQCKNCGICIKYCPNSIDKYQNLAKTLNSTDEPQAFGLQNADYYVAWSKDKEQRQKSCSGGITTELAKYLFENHIIDGMIHVERLWGKKGDLHYGAKISYSLEEIQKNVSSAYQAIDFSDVLSKLEKGKTYFMTGTPCVIRGIKNLLKNKDFDKVKILTCALVCSHNTNAQFIDFLTEINELCEKNKKWKVNIRHKDESIPDANNFKNYIYTKDGTELLNKNRFDSGWTHIWRNYYFAMGACLKCPDFWGFEADVSIKDAWGEWASDPLGKSIVIIRNQELKQIFSKLNIEQEPLSYDVMKDHQIVTSNFKQVQAYNKNFSSIFSKSNRRNELLKYTILSSCSKFLYKYFGYKITKSLMNIVEIIANRSAKF